MRAAGHRHPKTRRRRSPRPPQIRNRLAVAQRAAPRGLDASWADAPFRRHCRDRSRRAVAVAGVRGVSGRDAIPRAESAALGAGPWSRLPCPRRRPARRRRRRRRRHRLDRSRRQHNRRNRRRRHRARRPIRFHPRQRQVQTQAAEADGPLRAAGAQASPRTRPSWAVGCE